MVDDNILTLDPPEFAQSLPERVECGRRHTGRRRKKTYPSAIRPDRTDGGIVRPSAWLSTAAIFRQPSIRRNLI